MNGLLTSYTRSRETFRVWEAAKILGHFQVHFPRVLKVILAMAEGGKDGESERAREEEGERERGREGRGEGWRVEGGWYQDSERESGRCGRSGEEDSERTKQGEERDREVGWTIEKDEKGKRKT